MAVAKQKKPVGRPRKKQGGSMAGRINKINIWLKHYLDDGCSTTFLNKKESARKAGYKTTNEDSLTSIGCQNYRKLRDKIHKWLDDEGLSDAVLKTKLLSLMSAKETKFFAKDGIVEDSREVEAIETQRKALDMAIKVRGLYAPEKREHKFPGLKVISNVPE